MLELECHHLQVDNRRAKHNMNAILHSYLVASDPLIAVIAALNWSRGSWDLRKDGRVLYSAEVTWATAGGGMAMLALAGVKPEVASRLPVSSIDDVDDAGSCML